MSSACASGFLTSPDYLLTWEHTVTIISTPIHIFGFYCILYKTPSSMSTVKWSLLNLHIWTILLDYSFSFLVIPFILWPTMGGVPLGVLKDSGISTCLQFYALMVLMGIVAVSILSMFESRFNILFIKQNDFWSRARSPWLFIHYIASFFYMAPPFLNASNQDDLISQSFHNVPCLPTFILGAPVFILSLDIVYSTLAIGLFTVDIVLEVLFFFFTIYSRILKQLNSYSMSTKTFKLQRLLLVSLFIQVLIPLNLFIFPIIYVTYATIFGVYNQTRNNLSIAVASTHGICSTVTMILIHRPYRNVILKYFGVREMRTEINSAKTMTQNKNNYNILRGKYSAVPKEIVREKLTDANGHMFPAEIAIEKYAKAHNIPIPKRHKPIGGTVRLENFEYSQKKKEYRAGLDKLHDLRKQDPNWTESAHEPFTHAINSRVIDWNKENPVAPGYYDLHGMTSKTAADYVEYLLADTQMSELKFETGVGKHSTNKFSSVRHAVEVRLKLLKENPKLRKEAKIREFEMAYAQDNEGVIMVKF